MVNISKNNNIKFPENNSLSENNCNVVLFTSATHLGLWLAFLLDISFWLIDQLQAEVIEKKQPIHIKIILLPANSSQINPIKKLLRESIKKLIRFLPNIIKPKKFLHQNSLYNQIHSGKEVHLQFGQNSCRFNYYNNLSFKNIFIFLKSYFIAITLWLKCYQGGHFSVQKFLKLNYQKIQIGTYIASTTLREKSRLGGSLKPCYKLFSNLVNSIYICNLCQVLPIDKSNENYSVLPEPIYYSHIYSEALHDLGATIIDQQFYYNRYGLIKPNQKRLNSLIIRKPKIRSCSLVEKKQVENYMNIRLNHSNQVLNYMLFGQNENRTSDIKDISGNTILLSDSSLYVVIFLHSFDDAQYIYGYDGFDDLYHWTIFTIDNCLMNSSINTIFIKQHPNVDYNLYPGDYKALKEIIKKYKGNKQIIFLNKSSSIIALAKKTHVVGITHHGSIAEEFVYLHQPVIASVFAPWYSNYSFARTWQNPEEYKNMLSSLSLETWSPVSESELQSLFSYILEYRLNEFAVKFYEQKNGRMIQFAKVFFNNEDIELTKENYDLAEKALREMSCDDEVFQNYINFLTKYHSLN